MISRIMNLFSFSHRLFKKLVFVATVWGLLLIVFIVITVSLTRNLEMNGIVLSEFGLLNGKMHQVLIASQRGANNEDMAILGEQIKHSQAHIQHSLELCCKDLIRGEFAQSVAQLDRLLGLFTTTLARTDLMISHKKQLLLTQSGQLTQLILQYIQKIEYQNTQTIACLRIYRLGLVLLLISSTALGFLLLKFKVFQPLTMMANELIALKQKQKHYAVLEERNLIAQYLHDSVAQSLLFLNMQLQELTKNAVLMQDEYLKKRICLIQKGMQYCHEDIRELLSNFRTKVDYNNTQEMIEAVIDRLQKKINIPINLYIVSDQVHLYDKQKIQFIFILQETISNSSRHSGATEINVTIDDDEDFSMVVEDNGCGFDKSSYLEGAQGGGSHIGMAIMQERAVKMKAILNVSSQENKGTKIELILPALQRHIIEEYEKNDITSITE